MSEYTIEGVVAYSFPFGESDIVLTVFTPDRGKVKVLVRGGRKGKFAQAQLFTKADFLLFEGKTFAILKEIKIKENFPLIKEKLKLMVYASFLAELLLNLLQPEEKDRESYNVFVYALETFNKGGDPELTLLFTELKLISLAGLSPQLNYCVICDKKIKSPVYFSALKGGVLCSNCREESKDVINIQREVISSLIYLNSLPKLELNWKFSLPLNLKQQLRNVLNRFEEVFLGKRLQSLPLMEKYFLSKERRDKNETNKAFHCPS